MFKYNDESQAMNDVADFMWYWFELGYNLNIDIVEVRI